MSWQARLVGTALVLGAVVAGIGGVARGADAAFASACGTCLALLAQVGAVALLRPALDARTPAFMQRWLAGLGVRGASVVLLAALMVLTRRAFPILWMAAGYLGVMLPLLFTETRFLR